MSERSPPTVFFCPRCNSKRVMARVDGAKVCRRCGQRWNQNEIIHSADKREKNGGKTASQYAFPNFGMQKK